MEIEQLERNRRTQADLYGQDLRSLFGRVITALDLTQSQLARVIGISAPMLSQLMSAHRVKVANPAAVQRIHALTELTEEVDAGRLSPGEAAARLDEIRTFNGTLTRPTTQTSARQAPPAADVVTALRNLLRAVASGRELEQVATGLEAEHPDLAELIRVYGVGRQEEALEHYRRHEHLT